jgi:hypothetical protein
MVYAGGFNESVGWIVSRPDGTVALPIRELRIPADECWLRPARRS